MRKKLSSSGDFRKVREGKGVILVNKPVKPTAMRTTIHRPTCHSLDNIPGMQGTADDFVIKPSNKQEYLYYDSVDEAKADYDSATPCGICKP